MVSLFPFVFPLVKFLFLIRNLEKLSLKACLYDRQDGTFTGTGRLLSRVYMNFLQAGQ